jgi:transcriptional regulator with XRE-family HTH domain
MDKCLWKGILMPPKTPLDPFAKRDLAHFAKSLHQWRQDRGLMLKEVANQFGVAEATWSRWEKQERFPSPGNLRRLAEFIGVPICCFFYPGPGSCPNCPGSRPSS